MKLYLITYHFLRAGVHDASSRSHAIIKLRLRVSAAEPDRRRGGESKSTEAIVSLVDLAGSERASETKQVISKDLCGMEPFVESGLICGTD